MLKIDTTPRGAILDSFSLVTSFVKIYINFIKFFIVNKYHEEMIQTAAYHCEKC